MEAKLAEKKASEAPIEKNVFCRQKKKAAPSIPRKAWYVLS